MHQQKDFSVSLWLFVSEFIFLTLFLFFHNFFWSCFVNGLSLIVSGELFSVIGDMCKEPLIFLEMLVISPIFIFGFFFTIAFFILTFFSLRELFFLIYKEDAPLFPEEENKN